MKVMGGLIKIVLKELIFVNVWGSWLLYYVGLLLGLFFMRENMSILFDIMILV